MEQFSLDKWLKDKSRKVVTRDGREVDIYYSPTSRVPLIGRTSDNEVHQYTEDGFQYDRINEAKNDLFFADEEEELTEFEKELKAMIQDIERSYFTDESFDFWKDRLLDLARKELEKEYRLCDKDDSNWEAGWSSCHKDLIQNLPKWKKSTKILSENPFLAFYPSDDHRNLCVNGFEINIHELFETLPKEE